MAAPAPTAAQSGATSRFFISIPDVRDVNAHDLWVGRLSQHARWNSFGEPDPDDTIFGGPSVATGVNDDGTIIGWGDDTEGVRRAFLRQPDSGEVIDLGTLGGTDSWAEDITESGVVVGASDVEGDGAHRAFRYDPSTDTMVDLGTLGGTNSAAMAINEHGDVVGWSDLRGDTHRTSFHYDAETDTMHPVGDFDAGVTATAIGISDNGWIVGNAEAYDPDWGFELAAGFLIDPADGVVQWAPRPDGAMWQTVSGINRHGLVVGTGVTLSCSHCPLPSWGYVFDPVTGALHVEGGTNPTVAYTALGPTGRVYGTSVSASAPWTPQINSTISRWVSLSPRDPEQVRRNDCLTLSTLHWAPPSFDGYRPVTGYDVTVGDGEPTTTDQTRWTGPPATGGGDDPSWVVSARNAKGVSPGAEPTEIVTLGFTDVDAGHPFVAEIDWLTCNELATGFPDGTFRPGATVTRQAVVAFLWRLAGSPMVEHPEFSDVGADHPFAPAITWAASNDITTGYPDGTFRPGATVTRQAIAAFLTRSQH